MTPAEVCRAIYDAGLAVRVDGADLMVRPTSRLTPALRELLLAHKAELIEFLREAERTAAELVEAAMRACDSWKDGGPSREQMRSDCANVPPHQRADLRDHFRRSYPEH